MPIASHHNPNDLNSLESRMGSSSLLLEPKPVAKLLDGASTVNEWSVVVSVSRGEKIRNVVEHESITTKPSFAHRGMLRDQNYVDQN